MKFNFSFKEKIVIAVIFQLFIIFVLIFGNLFMTSSGNEIFLKIESLEKDYRLEQNYLDIGYSISTISGDYEDMFKSDDIVYVILEKSSQNNQYEFKSIQKDKPNSGIFIKGKIAYSVYCSEDYFRYYNYECEITVIYGIESFFVPNTEPYLVEGNKYAKIMINKDGEAILKGIYINDKKI